MVENSHQLFVCCNQQEIPIGEKNKKDIKCLVKQNKNGTFAEKCRL